MQRPPTGWWLPTQAGTLGGRIIRDVGCSHGELTSYIKGRFATYAGANVLRYDGFPSAAAQGTLANAQHYSRIVLADVPSASARYLVQMTVTTKSDQPIAQSPPLTEIVSGFTVAGS